jgi:peptidoglycan/xylan/chitin deacetylase (PgdA/CDA1 family)
MVSRNPIRSVETNQKMIAFTFDDGPSPIYTPILLDLLQEFNAKATFFVLGERFEQFPEIVQREVRDGHEIGNHTYHHFDMTQLSPEQQKVELELSHELIIKHTGKPSCLFRPPFGIYDEQLLNITSSMGYEVIMWREENDVKDWMLPGVDLMVSALCEQAGNGEIILLHDAGGEDRHQTLETMRRVLPILKEQGYSFVTVSELIKQGTLL